MDKSVKKEVDSMSEESCQPPDVKPVVKAEESHATHSFQWIWDKKPKNQSCNEAGTIENSLMKSRLFRGLAHKNRDKELVLQMDGKAISSHFPCSLIKNEHLTVHYVKAADQVTHISENSDLVDSPRQGQSAELVMFHVQTKGGARVVKIMRNSAFEASFQEITVYAYKGEEVKQALKRDGRLQDKVFSKNCALFNKSTGVITEMSDLVDDLDGKTFKIQLLKKSCLPESQPGSLVNALQRESQRSDKDPPQQSTATVPVNDNTSEELDSNMEPGQLSCEIPRSQEMLRYLSSQFRDLVQKMKKEQGNKRTSTQNLLRLDYGKNDQTCREVKTMKKLMNLSNSVCQVRINGRPAGSGFLLFDKFVLTNGHVLENTYFAVTGQLYREVTVHFSFESQEQREEEQEVVAKVEEVTGFKRCRDESGREYDWALLRLSDQNLPDPLITHCGFLPESGGICIIGHPYGNVKMIDPCFIVPTTDRNQVVERHYCEYPKESVEHIDENQESIQMVTELYFQGVAERVEQRKQFLTYETCFYFCSSGSPVFDEHCNVVAMHSGGYVYRHAKTDCSVIEFGHPLSTIIEQIIVQIVERRRFDVLKKYLAFDFACRQDIINNVKKLVESRNPTAFKNAANNPEVISDDSLKVFFEFLAQTEEPVPMES